MQPENNEKLVQFYNAINEYAEKQRLSILSETEEQFTAELARAEQEALSDAYRMIQRETAEMRSEIAKELSSKEYEGRKALFETRVAIEKKVFDEAAGRLRSFTETPAYAEYLKKAAAAALKAFSAAPDATEFRLREADMKYSEMLTAAFGAKCVFSADSSIALGGLRALNEKLGRALDVTLDSRLEQQHDWFCETAGLSIE